MTVQTRDTSTGPTRGAARILAPDFARGLVLLGIALANIVTAWVVTVTSGSTAMSLAPLGTSALDKATALVHATVIHQRCMPMFAVLLGYGVGMLVQREFRRGTPYPQARNLLLRRYALLIVFGAVHMVFLFWGDILVAYGMFALIGIFFTRMEPRKLMKIGIIVLFVGMLLSLPMMTGMLYMSSVSADLGPMSENNGYLVSQVVVGLMTLLSAPMTLLMTAYVFGLVLMGIAAGQMNLLGRVDELRSQFIKVAVGGIAIAWISGATLGSIMIYGPELHPGVTVLLTSLSYLFGSFGGIGYIAAIALGCQSWQRRANAAKEAGEPQPKLNPVSSAIRALGARSLSGYLFQSFAFALLLRPWGLGLASDATDAELVLWAVGVWLTSVILAAILDYFNLPGPFEALHRRMTYGGTRTAVEAAAPAGSGSSASDTTAVTAGADSTAHGDAAAAAAQPPTPESEGQTSSR